MDEASANAAWGSGPPGVGSPTASMVNALGIFLPECLQLSVESCNKISSFTDEGGYDVPRLKIFLGLVYIFPYVAQTAAANIFHGPPLVFF
jgi:hypothetical protein